MGQLDNLRTADASVFSTAGPLAYPGISYPMCDFEITMDIDAGVGEVLKNLQPAVDASRSLLGRSRGLECGCTTRLTVRGSSRA